MRTILIVKHIYTHWPTSLRNQPNGCAPSEDSDQPGRPPSLIKGANGSSLWSFTVLWEMKKILIVKHIYTHWTTSLQNQQNECAPSEDSDQPGRPPSLIKGANGSSLWSFTVLWEMKKILIVKHIYTHWTTSLQNQQNECAPSEDSDQPGRPPSLIKGANGSSLWSFTVLWEMKKILIVKHIYTHWPTSLQNQQNGCAPSEDSGQPGRPASLISVFTLRSIGS